MNDYLARKARYEELLQAPNSRVPCFAEHRHGSIDGHLIFGEDHTQASAIALLIAFDEILNSNRKTIVIGELPFGARAVAEGSELSAHRNDLPNWANAVSDLLNKRGVEFMTYDQTYFLRRANHAKNVDIESFMKLNIRRENAFAEVYKSKCSQYEQVIGVVGSMHAISPVLEKVLEKTPHGVYVFKGF